MEHNRYPKNYLTNVIIFQFINTSFIFLDSIDTPWMVEISHFALKFRTVKHFSLIVGTLIDIEDKTIFFTANRCGNSVT